ncbi:D-glycero-alpha-D-manno-heptose-1,7-bisphosphate 7-phosphatase [Cryptosporangium arvum]|uniref:D,D-heptose 1,7-bisphosphate phosphatase n=1 Tax=Cryptosporangium arvum DSM 44712 TaxID=927661 RepID=A0A010YNH4_9ACTN|nr:HAD family hydrolase [Cryptosporangium arvum]EXG81720.1 histidinol-phosphate phosphatase family protein [Cryptosporangium arvum DSM 44712]
MIAAAEAPAFAPGAWLYVHPERTRPRPDGDAPRLVLFDRDGTLTVDDPPYNGDPASVRLRPSAREALDVLRAEHVPVGVVSNQSGVGRGLLTRAQVESVADRIEQLLGRFDAWVFCPHAPAAGCACRKPAPGLVLAAADALGVAPGDTAVIGDIGADVGAAAAAGATGVLVPTAVTRPEEIAAAPRVAPDLLAAVHSLLGRGPA